MKIELHAHTSESSGCGKMPAEEMIGRFKGAGYDTVVVTDHFIGKKESDLTYAERVEKWIAGYKAAKKAGDRIGIHVLLGAEVRFASRPEDILIFGMKEEYAEEMFRMMDADIPQSEFYWKMHEKGMLVVQAHPFRKGLRPIEHKYLDGSEVYNGNARHRNHMDLAHYFGSQGGMKFIKTSGSDAHQTMDMARGGLISKTPVTTNDELLAFLRANPDAERIETP
ncbi:MAG: PHP domain-containing protein [Clostridia bacterium]|nr:PHP domain-containing protein [Clostridia bacterium]